MSHIPVECGLRCTCFLLNNSIRGAFWRVVGSGSCASIWNMQAFGRSKWARVKKGSSAQAIPFPVRFPPNPPAPRINTVDWFSNMTFPELTSLVSMIVVTAAAFPLSRTSRSLPTVIGIRLRYSRDRWNVPSFTNKWATCWDRCLDVHVLFPMKQFCLGCVQSSLVAMKLFTWIVTYRVEVRQPIKRNCGTRCELRNDTEGR